MAGDKADLVAEVEPVCGGADADLAVLVGGALVGGGGLVPDGRRTGIHAERLEPGIDDGAVLARPAHHRGPDEKARVEGADRLAILVEIAAVIGVHEDVGAALQFGVDAAPGLELEGAGAGAGDVAALDAVPGEKVAGHAGLLGRALDRLLPLFPGPQMLGRTVIGLE